MSEDKKMTLEEAFDKVDETIEKLRDENISLEDSFTLYKEGMELLKQCSEKIDTVEKQVLVLNREGEVDEF